jgi:hypothetical protein
VPTNVYFNNFAYAREQDLVEDLTIEAIKIYGHNVKYIPKTAARRDALFGEDTLATYDDAADLEMYIKNVEGFEGEGDFLSKFNLEIRDSVTFTVARKRFDQARSERLTTEVGYSYLQESANTAAPSRQFLSTSANTAYLSGINLETGTDEGYAITNNRPTEGDLIWFPMVDKLFEIKFVEHEAVFYQMGRLQTYDLRCELFTYSNERIDTGISDIDAIEDNLSTDILTFEFSLEDGGGYGAGVIQNEDGGSIMQEYRLEDAQPTANNEYFQSNDPVFSSSSIIDFSESNPFSEVDRF